MTGLDLITEERRRQKQKFSSAHDAEHRDGAFSINAAFLALYHTRRKDLVKEDEWCLIEKHKHDRIRCLTIAGALIAAEIDRLLEDKENLLPKGKLSIVMEVLNILDSNESPEKRIKHAMHVLHVERRKFDG